MTIRDYSTTPANNNAAPPNGWPEGQAASTVNDCARQMMAEIRETCEELPYFDFGDDPTRVDNDTFTVAGDLTARYPVGSRVKLVGATTGTGRITVSSHAAGTTTIDVVMDSGNVPTSLVRLAVVSAGAGSTATPAAVTLSASAGTSPGLSRADHVHALDQSIAPTMTAAWTFTHSYNNTIAPILMSSAIPMVEWNETDGAANNRLWQAFANSEAWVLRAITDDRATAANAAITIDRTGAVIDRVTFPTTAGGTSPFYVGQTAVGTLGSTVAAIHTDSASNRALSLASPTAATHTLVISNEATAGDNAFIGFYTENLFDTLRGSITYNRGGGVVAYNTTCREGLKKNIMPSAAALPLLMQIRVVEFDWRDSDAHLPYFVTYEGMEPLTPWACQNDGVDTSKLVPLTILGVQELREQVRALMTRVAALEAGGVGAIGK